MAQHAVPLLMNKALVRGYVTADGKAVAPHEDARRPAPRRREDEAGGAASAMGGGGGGEAAAPKPAPMPGAKKYAKAPAGGGYSVGQAVRVRGHAGTYKVTKVQGDVAWAEGPDGTIEVKQPGAAMAKAAGPSAAIPLLLKAAPPGKAPAKGPAKGPAGKKPAAPGAKAPARGGEEDKKPGQGGAAAPQGNPSVPPRGAPDGEHEMEHGDRVAFQHGKVRGEGTIVASGADGAMVLDDAGREHPVRHDNLLGPADSAEAPAELPKDENGRPAAPDRAVAGAGAAAEGDGKDGDKGDMGGGDETGADAAALASMDPKALGKIMQAIKLLAPLFGGSASKDAAAAKKKAPAK